jgi:alkanesulfonate monooxygenase SsuD/methylene tetrahydromethanopterin reductase-like flavin-dependent oxidoreductase (luciferase family)
MRFGVYLNPQSLGPEDDGAVIGEVLGQVDLAERLGFSSVWLTEHHFTGYNGFSDPIVLAAAISQRARALTLGFAVAVAPFHHPLVFAEQCNLLDHLSGGKLVVGFGAGNCPDEFDGFGLIKDECHAMMDEFVSVVEQAWTAPPDGFSYDGAFWKGVVRGRVIPAPVQRPHPHVAWGTTTLATVERLGRKGWSWLIAGGFDPPRLFPYLQRYLKAMDEVGLAAAAVERAWANTASVIRAYLADPGEDWQSTIGEHIERYVRRSMVANLGAEALQDEAAWRRTYYQNPVFAGTAEELVEKLRPYAELNVGTVMCWFNFGRLPDRLVRRSIERFARDVMPALQEVRPAPDLFERLRGPNLAIAETRRAADVDARTTAVTWGGTV